MWEFWNSLKAVSGTSTFVEAGSVILAAVYFFLERREHHLEERLKRPRKLSSSQRETLMKCLSDCPKGPIGVNFLGGDSEAAGYAAEFKDVFETAGFPIKEHGGFLELSEGVELRLEIGCKGSPPDYAITIETALTASGFSVQKHIIKAERNAWVSFDIGAKRQRNIEEFGWWNSLHDVVRRKHRLGWAVLLLLPTLIFITEYRQKTLENRQQAAQENQRATERADTERERDRLRQHIASLEAQVGPRKLIDEQKRKLAAALQQAPKGAVQVNIVYGDQEAQQFGYELMGELRKLGYTVGSPGAWGLGSPAGVWLKVKSNMNLPPHATPLLSAFRHAGVQVEDGTDSRINEGQVAIYVGSKGLQLPTH